MKQEISNVLDISINLDHSHLWGPLYPTNNINRFVLQGSGRSVEGVCESYKYLHLTGLWLGMMDRDNATDRNAYLIPHPSSHLIINSYPPVKIFRKNYSFRTIS